MNNDKKVAIFIESKLKELVDGIKKNFPGQEVYISDVEIDHSPKQRPTKVIGSIHFYDGTDDEEEPSSIHRIDLTL